MDILKAILADKQWPTMGANVTGGYDPNGLLYYQVNVFALWCETIKMRKTLQRLLGYPDYVFLKVIKDVFNRYYKLD